MGRDANPTHRDVGGIGVGFIPATVALCHPLVRQLYDVDARMKHACGIGGGSRCVEMLRAALHLMLGVTCGCRAGLKQET